MGPRQVPWGTPDRNLAVLDEVPSITTLCEQSGSSGPSCGQGRRLRNGSVSPGVTCGTQH